MAIKVLDSWALIVFFEDQPAAEQVEKILAQAAAEKHKLLFSVLNWAEVYYSTMRAVSQQAAEEHMRAVAALPINIVSPGDDLAIARQAAIYRATYGMAYVDCFAAALAKMKNAELLTGNPEFKAVEKEITINWIK